MADDIKGKRVGELYTRLYFRSTTSDIGSGTGAEFLTTSVEATGVAVDSALSLGTERVGIGNASPDELLHISGASDPAILITDTTNPCRLLMMTQDTSTAIGTTTAHPMSFITDSTAKMTILSNGLVGIGTQTPDQQLEVLNGGGLQLRLSHTSGSKYTTFAVDNNHDLTITPTSTGQVIFQPTTDSTDFFQVLDADGGTPILNIDSANEKVGIGKIPTAELDVAGTISGDSYLSIAGTGSPAISISDLTTPTTVVLTASDTEVTMVTATTHPLILGTDNNNIIYITSGGDVGIGGVSTPQSKLDIEGNLTVGSGYSGTTSALVNGMIVEGAVGIGTDSPDTQGLTVSGSAGADGILNLWADDGDDDPDKWRVTALSTGTLDIKSKSTGSWVSLLQVSPSEVTLGTDLNMGSNSLIGLTSGTSFQLTDADVAHGVTNIAPTNVYGDFGTIHGTRGGLYIQGLSDQESADARSLALRGVCNDTHTDTVSTVEIIGAKRSGATIQALDSAETVLEVANHTTPLMTVRADGLIKGTDFYIQQQSYNRITFPNLIILNNGDTSGGFITGATSTTSIDAEGVMRGMLYHAPVDMNIVNISGIIGSIGTVDDLSVYIMVSDDALTGDLDGAIDFTLLSTLSEAGTLTTDKAYYVSDSTGYTVGAGKYLLIGMTVSAGTNQYCNTNLTFQMRAIV